MVNATGACTLREAKGKSFWLAREDKVWNGKVAGSREREQLIKGSLPTSFYLWQQKILIKLSVTPQRENFILPLIQV